MERLSAVSELKFLLNKLNHKIRRMLSGSVENKPVRISRPEQPQQQLVVTFADHKNGDEIRVKIEGRPKPSQPSTHQRIRIHSKSSKVSKSSERIRLRESSLSDVRSPITELSHETLAWLTMIANQSQTIAESVALNIRDFLQVPRGELSRNNVVKFLSDYSIPGVMIAIHGHWYVLLNEKGPGQDITVWNPYTGIETHNFSDIVSSYKNYLLSISTGSETASRVSNALYTNQNWKEVILSQLAFMEPVDGGFEFEKKPIHVTLLDDLSMPLRVEKTRPRQPLNDTTSCGAYSIYFMITLAALLPDSHPFWQGMDKTTFLNKINSFGFKPITSESLGLST